MTLGAGETETPLRFAVIGCGAATRLYAAPALARLAARGLVKATRMFDPDADAMRAIAAILPSASAAADISAAMDDADVALIASPPGLHRVQAVDALQRGLHVFCEKPMALTAQDADEMIATAAARSRLLAVGLIRRYLPATRAIKALVANGAIGRLRSVSWFEGGPFSWPVASPRYFSREASGGGVLQDVGTHALDLLTWWCGSLHLLDYTDDAMGGVEANAALKLRAGDVDVRMRLSRDWARPNLVTIVGAEGAITWEVNEPLHVGISFVEGGFFGRLVAESTAEATDFVEIYAAQLADFAAAILQGRDAVVSTTAGRDACALVERCYRERRLMEMDWLPEAERASASRAGSAV